MIWCVILATFAGFEGVTTAQHRHCPRATLVTWSPQERTLAEFSEELARQGNVVIDLSQADATSSFRLGFSETSFWEALERLAETSNHRLRVTAQGSRAALVRGSRHRVPTSLSGPFRFVVRETRSRWDLETATSQTDVLIDVVWEPSFKAYFWQWERGSWRVEGSDGQLLPASVEGTSRLPIVGEQTPELRVQVRQVPREMTSFRRVAGRIRIVGTCQTPQFVFGLNETGKKLHREGVEAKFLDWRPNGPLAMATVELTYPTDMPEFESFQSFLVDHQAWLRHSKGQRYRLDQFEIQDVADGVFRLRYYVSGRGIEKPDLHSSENWTLALRVPGRIVETLVSFEFSDVPIP